MTEKSKTVYTEEGFTLLFSVQTVQKSMNMSLLDRLKGGRLHEETVFEIVSAAFEAWRSLSQLRRKFKIIQT